MERGVSWGAELLPLIDDVTDGALMSSSMHDNTVAVDVGKAPSHKDGGGGSSSTGLEDVPGRPVHKQRFVWTQELHCRFEAAVNTLGIDLAKPQVHGLT